MLFKALIIGLLIALGEVINGNIRVKLLQKNLRSKVQRNLAFFLALPSSLLSVGLPYRGLRLRIMKTV